MIEFIPPLFADFDDWLRVIIFIIFIVAPLLGQFGKPRAREAPPEPRPIPPRPRPPAGDGNAPPRNPVELEMERVLREFAGMAPEQPGSTPVPPPPPGSNPSPGPPGSPQVPRPTRASEEAPGRGPSARKPPKKRPREERPVSGASRPLSSSRPMRSLRSLPNDLEKADERVESHLRDVFGHDVGHLPSDASATAAKPAIAEGTDAAVWQQAVEQVVISPEERLRAIRQTMRDQDQIRQAFVLAEILRRPEW